MSPILGHTLVVAWSKYSQVKGASEVHECVCMWGRKEGGGECKKE